MEKTKCRSDLLNVKFKLSSIFLRKIYIIWLFIWDSKYNFLQTIIIKVNSELFDILEMLGCDIIGVLALASGKLE